MKLDLETLKKITVGAHAVTEDADGFHFTRFTDKQIAAWDALREDLGERARYSSGVNLDFHTNSKTLKFLASTCTMYDVCINGLLRESVNMHAKRIAGEPATIKLCDPLGDALDDVRVTIYFPRGNDSVVLPVLELDDGSYVKPHEFDHKFLFLGDSITAGCNAEHHSFCYAYSTARFFNAEAFNQGVGGGVFDAPCLEKTDFTPDTVFVAFGTNDYHFFETAEQMERSAREYMSKLKEIYSDSAKRFFVISPIWRAEFGIVCPMGTFKDAREIVARIAREFDMVLIDGLELVPPIPEFYQDGYLHPGDLGFAQYTQNLLSKIVKYF